MFDALSKGMSALQLSWDTPYRVLASLLSLGCACALFGWLAASSPLDALGHIGSYLGLPQAQEVTGSAARWLSGRKEVIGPVAGALLFLGVLTNVGDGRGRDSIPGPWRGAPTALIALAVIWEVEPGAIPAVLVQLGVALVAAYVLSRFARRAVNARSWLASTFANLLGSALFVLIPAVWMISRTTPNAAPK
uniref:Uncharacterized protein n=1 Tax=Arthrobacter sp. 31.31 TaxID=347202 RepID=I3VZF2_9MICC|nr:hypothetical protein [Arthrobacter sp. 31.31]AFK88729.1 hypothetical protein [Arthrobacter sp. 31.31]